MTTLIATENQEQRALVKWIRTQRKFDGLLIKLNNEGRRSEAQGWNLKLMGMEPGAHDLFLALPTTQYHGLWLEVKRNRKYSNSEMARGSFAAQIIFGERMKSIGFAAHFCYGWEHGKHLIECYTRTIASA